MKIVDMYGIGDGAYQADTESGWFVFAPSRLSAGNVECREYYPASAKDQALEVLTEARAKGLPL